MYMYILDDEINSFYLSNNQIKFLKELFIHLNLYKNDNAIEFDNFLKNLSINEIVNIITSLEKFINENNDCFFFVFLNNNDTSLLKENKYGWYRIHFNYKIYYKNINK